MISPICPASVEERNQQNKQLGSYSLNYTEPLAEQIFYCIAYHNVFRIEVITEGAIIKVDLIKGFLGQIDHFTLVETSIFMLADYWLPHGKILKGSLGSLRREREATVRICKWVK